MNRYYIVFNSGCGKYNSLGDYFTGSNARQAWKKAYSSIRKYIREGNKFYIVSYSIRKVINYSDIDY